MSDALDQSIEVANLRLGLFIHLDQGWLSHPFPFNSFKIQSPEQIATIRSLGIERIRYSPDKSDPEEFALENREGSSAPKRPREQEREQRKALLKGQNERLKACEQQYVQASSAYKQLLAQTKANPEQSLAQSKTLVTGVLKQIHRHGECNIRLLSEQIGDRASIHTINVLVLSLLLGKASGLGETDLQALGCGALLHDIGKQDLPNRLRWLDEQFTSSERKLYQDHISFGLTLGNKMGLSSPILLCIAQHHEAANGSGYPMRLAGDQISPLARIVALTNTYDSLCNPGNPAAALTPHEALSALYSKKKNHFDVQTMSVFIHMMGVYPPGSVVQLTDERYALVVSVNSSRPLKPRLIIHDSRIPKEEALIIDLEHQTHLGIRRSIKSIQLPRQVLDYLSPRQHICYFFERASSLTGSEAPS